MTKLHGSGELEIGRMVLSVFPSNIREVSQLEHYWLAGALRLSVRDSFHLKSPAGFIKYLEED